MKVFTSKDEKIQAIKKMANLRVRWENAVKQGLTAEEMRKIGIKTLQIVD